MTSAVRQRLATYLRGSGLELGPGHNPFAPLPAGVTIRYVDRWEPGDNASLFPELGEDAGFPPPDVVANLDVERLSAFADCSEDFVICSHILEHMADPIGMLCEIHRVLRPGGVVLILLPDRHLTFDRFRNATPLSHLIAEHDAGVTEVGDDHIEDFMHSAFLENPQNGSVPTDPDERRALFAQHRLRSIHAHCWEQGEFVPVITHTIAARGASWEFVDGSLTAEDGSERREFGFVLRRGVTRSSSRRTLKRFNSEWNAWNRQKTPTP
jgi:SAM-dependent methyltransferase